MDKHFYPEREADAAWPDGCPCCGEPVRDFSPSSDDDYAVWTFGCGCEIYFDSDVLCPVVEDDCPDAMDQHIEGLVIHTTDAA